MKKWGRIVPVILQLAGVITLVLAGVAGWKWG